MDRARFDALARVVAARGTRRAALGALIGGLLFGRDLPAADAKRGRGKGRGKTKANDNGKTKRRGKGNDTKRGKDRKDHGREARAEAATCCSGGNCAPGKGKNLAKCCYQGQDLTGKNFQGANLGSANFSGATLSNANLQGANLGKACLVGADLRGARINGSTNLGGVIYCRTQTDTGENNAGCGLGTPCCPTCDDQRPCGAGEVCCNARCVPGNCCGEGQSTCATDELCCGNTCTAGECCAATDCPTESCQRRSCQANQCVYDPVFGEPGPRCQTVCCQDEAGAPVCCAAGTAACGSTGICGCAAAADCDTDAGEICCDGTCRLPEWFDLTRFGSPGSGPSNHLFTEDVAVSADQKTVWVADNENERVSVWTQQADGSWANAAILGGPTAGSGANQFREPKGVAVSPDGQTLWVADAGNDRISVWTRQPNGSWTNQTTFGSAGSAPDQFSNPQGVDVSADGLRVWVAEAGNNRVSVWTRPNAGSIAWDPLIRFGTGPGSGNDQFSFPRHLAVSADEQSVWVGERDNNRVSVWTKQPDGSWANQTRFGSGPGSGPNEFDHPQGVAVANDDTTVWVADERNSRISIWAKQPDGSWANQTTFGTPPGTGPGQLRLPEGVEVSADGLTVYVADTPNDRIAIWRLGCPAPA